jgi:hypothetical protein
MPVTLPTFSAARRLSLLMIAATALSAAPSPATTPTATAETRAGQIKTAPASSVRVEYAGGYVPMEYLYTRTPSILLVGDRLYLPGIVPAVYPGPAVLPIEERTVSRTTAVRRVEALFAAARTPNGGWGTPPVADAPTVVVTVTHNGRTRTASVPALGLDNVGPGVTTYQSTARGKLRRALSALESLTGRSTAFRPNRLEAWVLGSDDIGWNPGEPSTSEPLVWPASVGRKPGCNVMPASLLPRGSNQASIYGEGTGATFRAVFRPVLPGEKACGRTLG